MLPGDVAQMILGQSATKATVDALRATMHLNEPAWQRYIHWLIGLLSGNPGTSLVNGMPIAELIGSRLTNSLLLALLTTIVVVPLALTVGITAAVWRGTAYDRVVNVLTVAAVSIPEFLFATTAVLIFAVRLHWLPALSYAANTDSLHAMFRSFALPVGTLSVAIFPQMARMTRAALINTLGSSLRGDGGAEGRAARPAGAAACIAECTRSDRQRDRAEPVVSARRHRDRRNRLQLSRPCQADGRCSQHTGRSAGAVLRHDLLCGLSAAGADRRYRGDPVQSAAEVPMSVTVETAVEILPRRRRARWPLLGRIAAVAVIACVGIAIFGAVIAPYRRARSSARPCSAPMTWADPLGTDYLGRDMLSRVLTGARYTIGVALPATLLASFAGTMLGMLAARGAARPIR